MGSELMPACPDCGSSASVSPSGLGGYLWHCSECCESFGMKKEDPKESAVEKPPHYTSGGMETIDILEAKLSQEEFEGYLLGNLLKYLTRFRLKGRPLEDLRKAKWYLSRLIGQLGAK